MSAGYQGILVSDLKYRVHGTDPATKSDLAPDVNNAQAEVLQLRRKPLQFANKENPCSVSPILSLFSKMCVHFMSLQATVIDSSKITQVY